jgi:hypothetical protein
LAVVELTENKMSINFLGREETSAICSGGRIKRGFDPVVASSISLRFLVRISREICADDNITTTQQLRVFGREIGVCARIIFTYQSL